MEERREKSQRRIPTASGPWTLKAFTVDTEVVFERTLSHGDYHGRRRKERTSAKVREANETKVVGRNGRSTQLTRREQNC